MNDLRFAYRQLLKNPGFTVHPPQYCCPTRVRISPHCSRRPGETRLRCYGGRVVAALTLRKGKLLTTEDAPDLRIVKAHFDKEVSAALEKVGMGHRSRHYPSQLSGGQQQRVAVARALAGKPAILLADEPTGNLDSKNGEAVMQLLAELHREGATICMVTHDDRFAGHAQRAVHLFDGRVTEERSEADHKSQITDHQPLPDS